MRRDLGVDSTSGCLFFAIAIALTDRWARGLRADAGRGRRCFDGGGQEVLQSILVPFMAHAPSA